MKILPLLVSVVLIAFSSCSVTTKLNKKAYHKSCNIRLLEKFRRHGNIQSVCLNDSEVFEMMVFKQEYSRCRFRLFCDAFVFKKGTIHEHFDLSQQIALFRSIYSEEEKLAVLHKDVTTVFDSSEQTVFKQYFAVNLAHTFHSPKTIDQAIQLLYLSGLQSNIPSCQHERFCICLEHYDADVVCSMLQNEIGPPEYIQECKKLKPLLYACLSTLNLNAHYITTYRKSTPFIPTFLNATSLKERLQLVIEKYFEFRLRVLNQDLNFTEDQLADHIVRCFSPAQVVREALNNNQKSSAKYIIGNYHVPMHYYVLKPLFRPEERNRWLGDYSKAKPFLKFSESMEEWCHEDNNSSIIRTPETNQPFFEMICDDSLLKYIILKACKGGLGYFLSVRFVCKRWFDLLTIQEILQYQTEQAIEINDAGFQFYLEHAYSKSRKIETILEYSLKCLTRIPRSRNLFDSNYVNSESLYRQSLQVSCPILAAKALHVEYLTLGNKFSALSKECSCSRSFRYEMLKNLQRYFPEAFREYVSTKGSQTTVLNMISDFGCDDDDLCKGMVQEVLNSLADPSDLKYSIIIRQWAFQRYSEQVIRHLGIIECDFKEALRCFHALDFRFESSFIPAVCKLVIEDFATTKSIDMNNLRYLSPIHLMVAFFKSNNPSEMMSELMDHLHVNYRKVLNALIEQSGQ